MKQSRPIRMAPFGIRSLDYNKKDNGIWTEADETPFPKNQ
jgi:hypothetical protein